MKGGRKEWGGERAHGVESSYLEHLEPLSLARSLSPLPPLPPPPPPDLWTMYSLATVGYKELK